MPTHRVHVSQEVREAVAAGRPVLALESTIFTHGLPRPRNLQVALEAEAQLRAGGVVPATIGVYAGVKLAGPFALAATAFLLVYGLHVGHLPAAWQPLAPAAGALLGFIAPDL